MRTLTPLALARKHPSDSERSHRNGIVPAIGVDSNRGAGACRQHANASAEDIDA